MFETTVAVIGGGPAGVAAAIWLHQSRIPVVLLESGPALGGLQRRSPYRNDWIPGVRGKSGQDVAEALHEHTLAVGCGVCLNSAVRNVDYDRTSFVIHLDGDRKLGSRFVVVATGAVPRSGGFRETESVGIGPGHSMERIAMAGKRVAILGGGDNAFGQALLAARRGARQVTIFTRQAPRAKPALRERFPSDDVHVGPFVADQTTMTVGPDHFDVIGVQFGFEAVPVPGLPLNQVDGYIAVDRRGEASIPRVYACGDVTNFWHPCVVTACAHGIQVAKAISSTVWRADGQV